MMNKVKIKWALSFRKAQVLFIFSSILSGIYRNIFLFYKLIKELKFLKKIHRYREM